LLAQLRYFGEKNMDEFTLEAAIGVRDLSTQWKDAEN
jgi:hypothetical protein